MNSMKRTFLTLLLGVLMITAVSCKANDPDTTDNNDNDTNANADTTANESDTTSSDDENGDGEQTIITFAVNGWERGLYENRIEAFEEAHSDIKVELVSVDDLMGNRTQTGNSVVVEVRGPGDELLNLVQGADVISWYLQPGFVGDGLLLNLAPLMEGDDNFDASDYYPNILEQYQWDGGTWAVPTSASYMLIYYDKDLFDAAGVDYPKAGWSWDDFVATAQATTLREGNEVTQWGFFSQFSDPLQLVQAKAGPIFNLANDPPTARLDAPEVVEAFQWIVDLYDKYEVSPYAPQPQSEEDAAAFEEMYRLMEDGKVAMWPDNAESYFWRSEERNLGVVPFPISRDNEQSSPITSWGGSTLAISAGTAYPQAAWEWIKFLTQQTGDNTFAFGPGGPISLPARRSVAEVGGVWDEMDDELADALRFAVEHGFVPVYPPAGGEKVYQALDFVLGEGKDVTDVLAEAQQAFESEIEEAMSEQVEATPIPSFTVAEPPSSQIEEGDVVVHFVVAGGDPSFYRQAAEDFHELHPDIVVKVEEPNFYNEEFSLEGIIGDADVFQWWAPIQSGDDLALVLAVQPLLDADPDISEDDFFPAVLDQYRAQGQVVGLPAEVQVAFLSFNKRLFDAAEIEYPQPGWTMDDFLQTAVALTQGDSEEDKIYGYVPDLYEMGDMMTFFVRQGASFIDNDVDPAAANFTDPDTIAAVRWYTNLTTEYEVKPSFDLSPTAAFTNDPFEERQAIIENDRAAIWKDDQYGVVYYDENGESISEEADRSYVGVVPYPVGDNGTAGFESVNGYYIAAQTEVRQAAWEWLKYLTEQESLAAWGLPARISTAESDEFVQRVGAEKAAVMIAAVENSSQANLISDFYSESDSWLGPAIGIGLQTAYNDIVKEEATVEEALQIAQDKADSYRQCIIDNDLVDSDDYQKFEPCMKDAGLSWDDF